MNSNVSKIVTDRIIEMVEKDNVLPWQKPWFMNENTGLKSNLLNPERHYSFLNHILLCDCSDRFYLTFKQLDELGANLKQGSKSNIITFWKILEKEAPNKFGRLEKKTIPMLRYFRVFGVSCIENLPEKYQKLIDEAQNKQPENVKAKNKKAEKYIANTKATIVNINNNRAYYSPLDDLINVPDVNNFKSKDGYYSTLLHELIHWTGHQTRLNRDRHKFFADETYGKEELIAEIGAAIIKRKFGFISIENSVSYVKNWLQIFKNDSSLLISAASKSQEAIEFLDRLQNAEVKDNGKAA